MADDRLRAGVHALVTSVVELGGAVGYIDPPPRPETDRLLDDLLGGVLCCVWDVEGLAAMGGLRLRSGVFAHSVVLHRVMTHPRTRGRGLARTVCSALVDRARTDGMEHVLLGVRGNNARAIALYASMGFVEVGRFRDTIEVRHERYDDVRMMLDLGAGPGVVRRGSGPGGAGS